MYQIVQSPAEILRIPTKQVDFSGSRLEKIITEMTETLLTQKDPEGIGLAANQVNLPVSLFLARFGTKKTDPVRVFINPEIIDHSADLQSDKESKQLEGCLSLPNYYGSVRRWKWIRVRFKNYDSRFKKLDDLEEKFEDFPAVIIQHEMDHLSGIIFVQRILEQKGKLYKINGVDKKGKEIWDEVEI